MEPIKRGMQGAAVEDVQTRLQKLGYELDQGELDKKEYGDSTAAAVASFRGANGLESGDEVDTPCWTKLVDESYQLGDRTLYLRVPNFKGADVKALQQALNVLGFTCGAEDGIFGPHTEAAVQQFQENVGLLADGMAFQDTFRYIERLHHAWRDKPASTPEESESHVGFARAANVLESYRIAIGGEDAISRSVASRMWNIATATTETSGLVLYNGEPPENMDIVFDLAMDSLPEDAAPRATIVLVECVNLSQRIRTAIAAAKRRPALVRVELTGMTDYGRFTASDAQMLAVRLLDGVCDALSEQVR